MPKNKRTITVSADEEIQIEAMQDEPEEEKTLNEKAADVVTSITKCGHKNLHAADEPLCTLDKGHAGDHSDGESAWSDAAGTPTKKHGKEV
jgi:hypothetical protein